MQIRKQDRIAKIRRGVLVIGGLAAALSLISCTGGRGGSVAYDPEGFIAPDVARPVLPEGSQTINPLDKVRVSVFQVPDLSGEFQVDAAGNISFPLIGSVEAQGKTASDLGQHIADRLSQRYLKSPNVQVALTEATPQTITVDGAVREPGVIPIKGATTLMRAVALARGTTEDANPSRVLIMRTIKGQRMAAAFDLRSIRRAESPDPEVYGNDIIVVHGDRTKALFKDIIATIPVLGYFRPF